ncbi:SH3 domain-containing protein Dlish [Araneus ventricosus]|uniref:SH3 domain-containing protein Dlish n=1 Tax=Araneus ventricosus TaxID=182803 RepID=A0A4Y2X876_ARAVE|nr:SH3 domain-containing protein Dlish [Araneus ventricosus]
MPESSSNINVLSFNQNNPSSSSQSSARCSPIFHRSCWKVYCPKYFIVRDENDVSVERGEFVTMLNREYHDWFWIVQSDRQEGFVPSAFVYPADVIQVNILRM